MKLKTKFIIITLFSSLVLALLINGFYIYKTRETLYEEFKNRSMLIAKSFSALAKEALNNEDDLLLISYVDTMKKEENVLYIGILDDNKTVIAHSDSREMDKAYIVDEEGIFFQDGILKVNNVIALNSGVKYLSIAGFTTEILKSDLKYIATQATVVSIIIVFIPVIILSFFINKLMCSLNKIQDSIQLANEGIYKQEIKTDKEEIEIINIVKNLAKLYEKIETNPVDKNIAVGIKDESFFASALGTGEIIKSLINNIKDGIILTNQRNSVLFYNEYCRKILKRDELEGKHILEICKENKELLSLFNESIKKKNESIKSKIKINEMNLDVTIKTIAKENNIIGSIIVLTP